MKYAILIVIGFLVAWLFVSQFQKIDVKIQGNNAQASQLQQLDQ